MKKFLISLLDLIYRKKCYFCGNSKHSIKMCPDCFEKLEYNNFTVNRIILGTDVYCAGVYTKELQKLIRGLKYHKQTELAFYQAKFMYDYFLHLENLKNIDFEIISVPLHKNRIKTRKYNHMDLVCEEFSRLTGYSYNPNLIKRIKDTKPQYNLSKKERLLNLNSAFEVTTENSSDKTLLIMDDICTSGTTFEEIIKSLHEKGYDKIICFATSSPVALYK